MLPEMKKRTTVRWITDCLMIYCVICASGVEAQENPRALLLYSSDSTPSASSSNNLIYIQLDSITLNKIIANSESQAKVVKKINFRDVNGFAKLVEGESSKFSFFEDESRGVCDASCDVRCKKAPKPPPNPFIEKEDSGVPPPLTTRAPLRPPSRAPYTTTTRAPYTRVQPTSRGPTYLPPISVTKKDEGIHPESTTRLSPKTTFIQTTSQRPTFPSTTRLQTTQRTTSQRPATERPIITQRVTTQRPTTGFVTRPRSSTPGPAYLPVSKKSTIRQTVTERSYPPATWPSTTRLYTQTFPSWSAPIRRSTEAKITTTTAKYLYAAPSNALIYAGEAE